MSLPTAKMRRIVGQWWIILPAAQQADAVQMLGPFTWAECNVEHDQGIKDGKWVKERE